MKEYLSHYTNVESLEKILESKSIKLNALKNMNDENEGRNREKIHTQGMMYSSSWCDDNTDNGMEYMWQKYTKSGKGVRISLPKYPFKKYLYVGKNFKNEDEKPYEVYIQPELHDDFLDGSKLFRLLRKVEYTDDKDKYLPSIVSKDGHWFQINTNKLGIYKETKWQEEKEWRYILTLLSRTLPRITPENFNYAVENIYPNEIYLKIRSSFIHQMKVFIPETTTNENKKAIMDLQKKYKFKILNT